MRRTVSPVLSFLSDQAIEILSKYSEGLESAERGVLAQRRGRPWPQGYLPRNIVVAVNAFPIAVRLEGEPELVLDDENLPRPIELVQVCMDGVEIYMQIFPTREVVFQLVHDIAIVQQLAGLFAAHRPPVGQ